MPKKSVDGIQIMPIIVLYFTDKVNFQSFIYIYIYIYVCVK